MVAKGHDAPGVTADRRHPRRRVAAFPDFRAAERTFQLLAQVAGRAGRGAKPGRVLVQTRQPDHPSLIAATRHDFASFARTELLLRQELGYPALRTSGAHRRRGLRRTTSRVARRALAERLIAAAGRVDAARRPQILGPAPAPIERLRGRDRSQLLIKAADHRTLAQVLDAAGRSIGSPDRATRRCASSLM